MRKKISSTLQGIDLKDWKSFTHFEPYDDNFNNKFKRAIRKRDNYICMNCGKHQEKEKNSLSIHHIDYNKKLSIHQNCISLCRSCHALTQKNRRSWIKFFQSLLSERYGYRYSENNEVILEVNE